MIKSVILVALVSLPLTGCAQSPPHLSPAGTTAFHNLQIQKVLDLIRDTAHDGNATIPPVITTTTARRVTVWHRAAILTLHARADGWPATLNTGLDEIVQGLPPTEQRVLAPYVALAKLIITEVRQ